MKLVDVDSIGDLVERYIIEADYFRSDSSIGVSSTQICPSIGWYFHVESL